MFKLLTDKTRLRKAESENRVLKERVEELTSAIIELAEIIAEEVDNG